MSFWVQDGVITKSAHAWQGEAGAVGTSLRALCQVCGACPRKHTANAFPHKPFAKRLDRRLLPIWDDFANSSKSVREEPAAGPRQFSLEVLHEQACLQAGAGLKGFLREAFENELEHGLEQVWRHSPYKPLTKRPDHRVMPVWSHFHCKCLSKQFNYTPGLVWSSLMLAMLYKAAHLHPGRGLNSCPWLVIWKNSITYPNWSGARSLTNPLRRSLLTHWQ